MSMDHISSRMSKLVHDYNNIKKENEELKNYHNSKNIASMKKPLVFPSNDNLYRLTLGNAKVGQILVCKVKGKILYTLITKVNPSVVSVKDLILKINENNYVEFYINDQINPVHKGNLGYSRHVNIIDYNEYII